MLKYIGKKHLNSNWYKKISLIRRDDDIEVKVKGNDLLKKAEPLKTSTPYITDTIKDLEDIEALKEIVAYFLRNNTICELDQENDYLIIRSTSNRELVLKIEHNREIANMVIEKYLYDLDRFVSLTDAKIVNIIGPHFVNLGNISTKTSSYGNFINENGEKEIYITYMSQIGKIIKYDEKFIDNYIKKEIKEASRCRYPLIKDVHYNLYLDDKKIVLPLSLREKYSHIMLNRIYELDKEKTKQLKLEGIK